MNAVPRIIAGVDGFESSKAALRWAIHQAKLTGVVVDAATTWPGPGSGTGRSSMTSGWPKPGTTAARMGKLSLL
jgi:hypothetical protein